MQGGAGKTGEGVGAGAESVVITGYSIVVPVQTFAIANQGENSKLFSNSPPAVTTIYSSCGVQTSYIYEVFPGTRK